MGRPNSLSPGPTRFSCVSRKPLNYTTLRARNYLSGNGTSALSSPAGANTWNLIFMDVTENTDVGFDHPTTGAEAQATALAVTQYIDTVISFPGTIDFRFNDEPANGTGSLANASAITNSAAVGFQPGAVVEHGGE